MLTLLAGAFGAGSLPTLAAATPPILLVVNSGAPNPFGPYLGEILRAEGIASFSTAELSAVTSATLSAAQLVVLAETPLTAAQAALFTGYVSGGGRLVAMRPDPQLAPALGVSAAGGSTANGYLAINAAGSGAGLPATTLPFFGTATNYTLAGGASSVAQLYSGRSASTPYAAVARTGSTAAWAFDLARSVAYARQGNPANAGADRDGQPPIRTTDIFYNAIDLERLHIPHADVQMRLFSRVVGDLLAASTPLPRLWYFPNARRTLLVLTSDDHGQSAAVFDSLASAAASRGGRISFYSPRWTANPTAAAAASYRSAGHEIGLHPYSYTDNVSLNQGFITNKEWFASQNRGAPSRTERTHQVEWQGWVDAAAVAASHGIGMDTSFYTWGASTRRADGSHAHGYITGSGLPLRFVSQSGTLLPIYQQATTLIDEALIGALGPDASNYTAEQALAVTRQIIDASQNGDYAALVTQFHADYYPFGEVQPWVLGTMDYAQAQGIPMWTAERWLRYVEARAGASVGELSWAPASNTLRFQVTVPASADAQTLLLPASYGGQALTGATVDGAAASVSTQTISGRATAFFSVGAGTSTVVAVYGAAAATPTGTPGGPTATATPLPPTATGTPGGPTATATSLPPTATGTPLPSATGTPLPSATSATPPSGDLLHTTVGDFSAACVSGSGARALASGDGAVGLDGAFRDDFPGPGLDAARWTSGTWSAGTYTPAFGGGALQVIGPGGAFVRSQGTFTRTTVEGVASFGAGAWQHVGFGANGFANDQYLLFSTFSTTSSLFARSNGGNGETTTNLGPIPAGFHTYRVEWASQSGTQDVVRYYLDDALVATHAVPTLPALYVYGSYNSGGAQPALQIDSFRVLPPYVTSGTFTSCALDAGASRVWSAASWLATLPAGTTLGVDLRTSADGVAWGAWAPATSGAALGAPRRYVQYRLSLGAASSATTPLLTSLSLSSSAAPVPTATATATATAPTATATVPTATATVPTATATAPTATATAPTATAPTATATAPTATATPVPTATATAPTATATVATATATVPTATATAPTATATAPTATATAPTATATVPTATATVPTATATVATATTTAPTATATVPTATATAPTATATAPTATATAPTSTPVPTDTPLPTATSTPAGPVTLVGETTVGDQVDSNPPGMAEAFVHTALQSGTAQKIVVYIDGSSAASQVIMGLYADGSGNRPAALLAEATLTSPTAGTWNTVTIPATEIVAGTRYWIAILGPIGTGEVRFRDASRGDFAVTSQATTLTALPAAWSTGNVYRNSPLSAYLTN